MIDHVQDAYRLCSHRKPFNLASRELILVFPLRTRWDDLINKDTLNCVILSQVDSQILKKED